MSMAVSFVREFNDPNCVTLRCPRFRGPRRASSRSILRRNMSFLDDLGKFREVGPEPRLELLGRAADRLIAGDAQTLEQIGRGQRLGGAALDDADDLARRVRGQEPALPTR